ncbi:putative ribonuclease H protein [Trifolium medium]|uniref:Putative ribonuclease H protein n=1 Tax=Trifolium medium TaxID=97028 RepID=A0A392P0P1_9FABA|nr:putative ribonuclease H protein [Trifolium medium]
MNTTEKINEFVVEFIMQSPYVSSSRNYVHAFSCPRLITSCRCLFKDHTGAFIIGFNANLSPCTVVASKLWGMYLALKLVRQRDFGNIIVESDPVTFVHLINKVA